MTETTTLKLPLIQPSQAQKHVTMNEALTRLDAALQLSVNSRNLTTPPSIASEGDAYLVPVNAVNSWENRGGLLAFYLNGGWDFLEPQIGWRIWVREEAVRVTFDGEAWLDNVLAMSGNRAAMRAEIVEIDYVLSGGATFEDTPYIIPAGSCVWGVTGRVLEDISGGLLTWSLGVSGSDTRYGSGLGTAAGSWLKGLTSQPVTYYSAMPLRLTADGGDFAGGQVRLALHLMQFDLPDGL